MITYVIENIIILSNEKRDAYCTCTCDGMIYAIIDFAKQDFCSLWQ